MSMSWTPIACGARITRIAHEILERNQAPTSWRWSASARAACRSPGASPARSKEINGDDVPTGALDITLYRDDLMRNAVGPQPVVRRTDIPFSIDDRRSCSWTTCSTPAGRFGRAGRADRFRPAAGDPAGRAGRPRPSRAADQGRLRRQELPDLARGERPGPAAGDRRRGRGRARGTEDERAGGEVMNVDAPSSDGFATRRDHAAQEPAPARHRRPRRRRDRADPRHRGGHEGDRRRARSRRSRRCAAARS